MDLSVLEDYNNHKELSECYMKHDEQQQLEIRNVKIHYKY